MILLCTLCILNLYWRTRTYWATSHNEQIPHPVKAQDAGAIYTYCEVSLIPLRWYNFIRSNNKYVYLSVNYKGHTNEPIPMIRDWSGTLINLLIKQGPSLQLVVMCSVPETSGGATHFQSAGHLAHSRSEHLHNSSHTSSSTFLPLQLQ